MLNYSLTENLLTERADDYTAQVQPLRSNDKEDIIERMLQRGTSLTRTDLLAVLNLFDEVIAETIESGEVVNLPLFNTSFSISGVFEGATDSFDANRHKLNVNLSKGTLLRQAEGKISLQKTTAVAPQPVILEVKDSVSGKTNEVLTPGGVAEIHGNNIKIAGDDASCGLWFVPSTGEALKAGVLVQNKPSAIIAMIPSLPAGTYTVKVITQYSGGSLLKSPRTCIFTKTLTVA